MGKVIFSEEFRIDAIKQITERGYSVRDVSQRLVWQISWINIRDISTAFGTINGVNACSVNVDNYVT